jgi:inner membrane protein
VEYLEQLIFWHWLILGVVLIALEILLPGYVVMWIGMAALLTGGILFLVPGMPWEYQFLVFAILSAACLFFGRKYIGNKEAPSDHPGLNKRGSNYVGRSYVLIDSIRDGVGNLIIDDTTWRVSGDDMPKGTNVKVIRMDGSTLVVEKE